VSDDLLVIQNLSVVVSAGPDSRPILDKVNLKVPRGSIFGVVGGSGGGKSTLAACVLRLLSPALKITRGQIIFDNYDLLTFPEKEMRRRRGKSIGLVFQDPLCAFNPLFTVGYQIGEVLRAGADYHSRARRARRVIELLEIAGITEPLRVARAYPHQLSGGMRQRAMIAQAIAGEPGLLIADEPTSSLDVTTQARIMALFRKLREELNLTIMLISHDLGMVARLAGNGAVMCEGRVVETGPVKRLLESPEHEYTRQLVEVFK
jgi:ABC-type dipeptide/oligopeptide/nickel transport system ATPase component